MHMPILRINDLAKLTKPGTYYDQKVSGLRLIVRGPKSKQWILRTTYNGKRTEFGVGSGLKLGLAKARLKAEEYHRLIQNGDDPRQVNRVSLQPTFAQSADAVWRLHKAGFKNPKHAAQWIATLKTYVHPTFGDKRVGDVDSSDVLSVVQPIWLKKPETAKRVLGRIKSIMEWSIAQGYREHDPTLKARLGLPKPKTKVKHHKAMPVLAVSGFVASLRISNAEPSTKFGLELLILTAKRVTEIRETDWTEIDLENRIWMIPRARLLKNQSSSHDHEIPLTGRMIEMLTQAQDQKIGRLVFPSRRGKPLSENTFTKLLQEITGQGYTTHGFRSTFKDWARGSGMPDADQISEIQLDHVEPNKAKAAYQRDQQTKARLTLLEQWERIVLP
jgi:integrase